MKIRPAQSTIGQMVTALGGQLDFVRLTSDQPRMWATESSAGNHCAACESPSRTTVVSLCAGP